jgi:hypothetical protein
MGQGTNGTHYDLDLLYRKARAFRGDIQAHLPALRKAAAACRHVTEFGVRACVSTTALLRGLMDVLGKRSHHSDPPRMVSYDVVESPQVALVALAAAEAGIDFTFRREDVLLADEIEETDLLFIDTWHVEEQLRRELRRHAHRVRRYIILHDTETCKEVGENQGFRGLKYALDEFLGRSTFTVVAHDPACNGLTVLKRIQYEDGPGVKPWPPDPPPARVYLGLPFAYNFCGQVVDSWDNGVDPHGQDTYQKWFSGGSFHTRNFNMLWCNALNTRNLGWTHFAMVHHDVRPYGYWLGTMLREMREHQADLVSVVLPVKTDHGLTSTALFHRPTGRVRRLTMKEVTRLPVTFDGPTAVRELAWPDTDPTDWELFVSTGLWLCDFTRPWVADVWFEVRERIVHSARDGYSVQVISEDWAFSHALHRLGLKLVATTGRAVPCGHWGPYEYTNYDPWGTLGEDNEVASYGDWYDWQTADGPHILDDEHVSSPAPLPSPPHGAVPLPTPSPAPVTPGPAGGRP